MERRDFPVALDYWVAKHVLIQTALRVGYTDVHTLDPDNTVRSGLTEAFGVWLNLTRDELVRSGYAFTTNEGRMNVYVSADSSVAKGSPLFLTGSLSVEIAASDVERNLVT